ncbi:Glycerate kinase [Pseudomonas syringae pv. actinidiae]|uniref:Glycerate kinase n=1 Tax=Pseudomonas syringae pv. actinidiae TaxID=103796 RepID=A0AAN4TMV5_PSESF|nr:Glycerate kinase [Pseudomonas syringae pv. actinidiae]
MRCRHRGAGLDAVTAARHGAVDQPAGHGDAPVFGQAALVVALTVGGVEARHGQPVAFEVRLEIWQRGAHAGVGVAGVAGAEYVDHAFARDVGRFVQPGATVVMLGIGGTHARFGGVGYVGRLAAPAVVDGAHASISQCAIHRLEILRVRVWAEQEAVVLIGVTDVDLRVVRHAMHLHSIARRTHGAGDVRAVGVVVGVDRASDAERCAVDVSACGGHCVIAGRAGFWVRRIETRVQRADLDPCAGDASGVGLISLNAAQAPIALKFCRAPTGRITQLSLLDIISVGRTAEGKRQRAQCASCYGF